MVPSAVKRVQANLGAWSRANPSAANPKDFAAQFPTSPDVTGVWTARTQQAMQAFQKWVNAGSFGELLRSKNVPPLMELGALEELSAHVLDLWAQKMLNGGPNGGAPTADDVEAWLRKREAPRAKVDHGRRAKDVLAGRLGAQDQLVEELRAKLEAAVQAGQATSAQARALEVALREASAARAAADQALQNAGVASTDVVAEVERLRAEVKRQAAELFEKEHAVAVAEDGAARDLAEREHREATEAMEKIAAAKRAAEEALHRQAPKPEAVPFHADNTPPLATKPAAQSPALDEPDSKDDGGAGTFLSLLGVGLALAGIA
jgi:hypothetical protein